MMEAIFARRRGIKQLTVEGAPIDISVVYWAEWALTRASTVCCAEYNWVL